MSFEHIPVLLQDCLEGLDIKPDGIYLDGTAGGGGHSYEIAKRLETGHLYSTDQDPDAIKAATQRLLGLNATVVKTNFRFAKQALAQMGVNEIDGALLDLGVSSYQLDEQERGFSYKGSAPLDMRMSQEGLSAADIVSTYPREELAKVLREYGEESFAWQIAGKIVEKRELSPILTTDDLVLAIKSALPAAVLRKEKNPARRTFQALRIEVNGEMQALKEGLNEIMSMLKPGGRFCVITFHSLEDRLVKQTFKQWATGCTCPPDFPVCVCNKKPRITLITRKPIIASGIELDENRRSRSAKLRVIEKI